MPLEQVGVHPLVVLASAGLAQVPAEQPELARAEQAGAVELACHLANSGVLGKSNIRATPTKQG